MKLDPVHRLARVALAGLFTSFFLTHAAWGQPKLKVPADHPTIQSAIDAAPDGATILVTAGTYHESPQIWGRADLTIKGKGKVKIVPQSSNGVTVFDSDRIVLDRLRVVGAPTRGVSIGSSSFVTVRRCTLVESGTVGVFVQGGIGHHLDRNDVVGQADGTGLDVDAERCVIEANEVHGGAVGLRLVGPGHAAVGNLLAAAETGLSTWAVTTSLLANNRLIGGKTGVSLVGDANSLVENEVVDAVDGLIVSGAHNRVTDNVVTGSADDGVRIGGSGGIIARNLVVAAAGDAVTIDSSADRALVLDNVVKKAGGTAYRVLGDHALLVGNTAMKSGIIDLFVNASATHGRFGNSFDVDAGPTVTLTVPGDHASIQSAIDAALPGTEVVVAAGTYTEDLVLAGRADLWLRAVGAVVVEPLGPTGVLVSGSSRITIDGLRVRGAASRGMHVTTSDEIRLIDVDVRDGAGIGVDVIATNRIEVRGARVEDVAKHGIRLEETSRALVSGSRIEGVGSPGSGFYGIEVRDCTNVLLDANEIDDTVSTGVRVANSTTALLRDNLVTDAGNGGFSVDAEGALLEGNRVVASTGLGIGVVGAACELHGSVVKGSSHEGIRVAVSGAVVRDNAVKKTMYSAFRLYSPQSATPDPIVAEGNVAKKAGKNGLDVSTTDALLLGNAAKKSHAFDLKVSAAPGANVLIGNTAKKVSS